MLYICFPKKRLRRKWCYFFYEYVFSIQIMEYHRKYAFGKCIVPGCFFSCLIEIIENHPNCVLKLKECRRQDLFAAPGMGIRRGGILYFRNIIYIYIYIYIYFYLFLPLFDLFRPYMGKIYVYQPNFNFPGTTHSNLFSSVRKQHISN